MNNRALVDAVYQQYFYGAILAQLSVGTTAEYYKTCRVWQYTRQILEMGEIRWKE